MIGSLAAALAPAFATEPERAVALGRELAERVQHPDDPEASVRFEAGELRAGRMMIERADIETAKYLALGLRLPWGTPSEALVRAVTELELPLIIGWDATPRGNLYKLYANASDRALEVRAELGRRFQVVGAVPPHLVGLNVSTDATELKAYFQSPNPPDIGISHADFGPGAVIAWVTAVLVRPASLEPRAIYAAISHDHRPEAERMLERTTSRSWSEIAAAFPFEPGPIRQIGWALDGAVTMYAKRNDSTQPLRALAPVAVFAMPGVEVGLYLEPNDETERAFARTLRSALSFRTQLGAPVAEQLEMLGAWAKERVERAEVGALQPDFSRPPAPWMLK